MTVIQYSVQLPSPVDASSFFKGRLSVYAVGCNQRHVDIAMAGTIQVQ